MTRRSSRPAASPSRRQADARHRSGRRAPQLGGIGALPPESLGLWLRHRLQIGPIQVWPPLILAPMSGVTNRTMRALYRPFGLGLTVTEFVSSNALMYGSRRTMEMIDQHGLERPVSTQLWGDDPATMALAAKVVRECGADIVDINFGCPAPKVTKTNGGSACLRDPKRCEAIMRAVVAAVDCPVTVKMRLGWSEDALVYLDVARRAQHAGVQAVTLHARTAKQFYKGRRGLGAHRAPQARRRHPGHRQWRSRRSASRHGAHARKRRGCHHARPRNARKSMAYRADSRSHGGTRGAPAARSVRTPSLCYRPLSRDGSASWAKRAPSRRCASTSRSISKASRARRSCGNASCTSNAATTRSESSKRRSRGSTRRRLRRNE